MSTPQKFPFKQGATFSVAGTVLLPEGDWTASCQIRTQDGDLVATCAVAVEALETPTEDATHSIVIEEPDTDTGGWPTGHLLSDVRFTAPGSPAIVDPTDTFVITVARRITDA